MEGRIIGVIEINITQGKLLRKSLLMERLNKFLGAQKAGKTNEAENTLFLD